MYFSQSEVSCSVYILMIAGGVVGCLSNIFGIGGGILMVPIFNFIGVSDSSIIPTATAYVFGNAYSSGAKKISNSNVDIKILCLLTAGGCAGSLIGLMLYNIIISGSHFKSVISCIYILSFMFSIIIGMSDIFRSTIARIKGKIIEVLLYINIEDEVRLDGLLEKENNEAKNIRFQLRNKELILKIFLLGSLIGLISCITGIGGAFIIVPSLCWILNCEFKVASSTALVHTMITSSINLILHGIHNSFPDIMLASICLTSSGIGAIVGNLIIMLVRPKFFKIFFLIFSFWMMIYHLLIDFGPVTSRFIIKY